MFGLGPMEIIIILVVMIVLFGAGKLPKLGEGVGKAISNFKCAVQESNASEIDRADQ